MANSFQISLDALTADQAQELRSEQKQELVQSEKALEELVKRRVRTYDEDLIDFLLEQRNPVLLAFVDESQAARVQMQKHQIAVEQILDNVKMPDIQTVVERTDAIRFVEKGYRDRPLSYLKLLTRCYGDLHPVLAFNRHHPIDPITTNTVMTTYASDRSGFVKFLPFGSYKDARMAIDLVASKNPHWLDRLSGFEKGLRKYVVMRNALNHLQERKHSMLLVRNELCWHRSSLQKELNVTSPGHVIKVMRRAVILALDTPSLFAGVTRKWPVSDVKAAKRLVNKAAFARQFL